MHDYSIHAKNFQIELVLKKGINYPIWKFSPTYSIISQVEVNDMQTVVVEIPVSSSASGIILTTSGKTDQDTVIENGKIVKDQMLTVNRVWANSVLLEHHLVKEQSQTIPNYNQSNLDYAREHNIELPKILYTDSLYYNSAWTFNFEQPFFKWYNQLLFEKLKMYNHWIAQSHLGIADDSQVRKLKKLIDCMS